MRAGLHSPGALSHPRTTNRMCLMPCRSKPKALHCADVAAIEECSGVERACGCLGFFAD
jgi:hypothetical protein